jgi:uncharacterized membrane protein (UPF0136 family)
MDPNMLLRWPWTWVIAVALATIGTIWLVASRKGFSVSKCLQTLSAGFGASALIVFFAVDGKDGWLFCAFAIPSWLCFIGSGLAPDNDKKQAINLLSVVASPPVVWGTLLGCFRDNGAGWMVAVVACVVYIAGWVAWLIEFKRRKGLVATTPTSPRLLPPVALRRFLSPKSCAPLSPPCLRYKLLTSAYRLTPQCLDIYQGERYNSPLSDFGHGL